jgi:hypothetical protein
MPRHVNDECNARHAAYLAVTHKVLRTYARCVYVHMNYLGGEGASSHVYIHI